MRYLIMCL
ncbi:unnamed protein product, partial [Cuscuta europaea]